MRLTPDYLGQRILAQVDDPAARLIVALSGGLDSTVLLHAAVKSDCGRTVLAAHVNHGLHEDSTAWAEHCADLAAALGVEFMQHDASIEPTGKGIEAAARDARYRYFASLLGPSDWLLLAHHRDDQAETVLLNLLRGSGARGLSGMPAVRALGAGMLFRPLLDLPRSALSEYANFAGLSWIDDPANDDRQFDRNFLRHRALPMLRSRWPAIDKKLQRSAALLAETEELNNALAGVDLISAGAAADISVARLRELSVVRRRNLLRFACRSLGLPPPPTGRLEQLASEVVDAAEDALPCVSWPGAEARRYRGRLLLMAPTDSSPRIDATLDPTTPVQLGSHLGSLALVQDGGPGIAADVAERGLRITFRSGGERLRPAAEGARRRLKQLLQEAGVVPWLRDAVPLLVADDRLVAVADLWIDADFQSATGYRVQWRNRPSLFRPTESLPDR